MLAIIGGTGLYARDGMQAQCHPGEATSVGQPLGRIDAQREWLAVRR